MVSVERWSAGPAFLRAPIPAAAYLLSQQEHIPLSVSHMYIAKGECLLTLWTAMRENAFVFQLFDLELADTLQYVLWVTVSPSPLKTLCLRKIRQRIPPHHLSALVLPQTVLEELTAHILPPYDRRGMRARFYNPSFPLHTLFTARDHRFSPDFVVWFQHECRIRHDLHTWHVVRLEFYTVTSECLSLCLPCVKALFENGQLKTPLFRLLTPLWCPERVYETEHWCEECHCVPLFEVVSEEQYLSLQNNPRRRIMFL